MRQKNISRLLRERKVILREKLKTSRRVGKRSGAGAKSG